MIDQILPLLLFGVAMMLTPGPNNFMLMNTGLNFGVRRGMPHFLGVLLGFPVMILVVSMGFGELFIRSAWMHQTLKIISIIYMVYLAWCMIRANKQFHRDKAQKPFRFLPIVLFQWVNPKGWMIAIGAASIFTVPSHGVYYQAAFLGAVFFIIGFFSSSAWLLLGVGIQRLLKNERHRRWFNYLMAICLLASIAIIVFD